MVITVNKPWKQQTLFIEWFDMALSYIYNYLRNNNFDSNFERACIKILSSYMMCGYSEKAYQV